MPVLQYVVSGRCEINSFQLDKWNKKQQIWESISSFGLSTDKSRRAFCCDCAASLVLVWERRDENEPGTARLMGQDRRLKSLIRQTSNQRNKAALIGGRIADTSDTCIYCVRSSLLLSTSSVGHFASIVEGDFSPEWVLNPADLDVKQIHFQNESGGSECGRLGETVIRQVITGTNSLSDSKRSFLPSLA